MAAKATRLEAELQFHDVKSLKTATPKKQEDEIKKLQIVKELTATHAEMEAVNKIEREHYGGLNFLCDEILAEDNGSEDHLDKYLQSQLDSTLPPSTTTTESNTITAHTLDAKAHASAMFSSCFGAPKVHTSTSEVQAQISLEDSIPFASPFCTGTVLPHGQPNKPSPVQRKA